MIKGSTISEKKELARAIAKSLPLGARYGKLTVIGAAKRQLHGTAIVWSIPMRCDCGKRLDVRRYAVMNADTRSCGCAANEYIGKANATHGHTRAGKKTPAFSSWSHMISRCTNQNTENFGYYGGRGIKVCQRWMESFEAFLKDMGQRPTPEHSIERRNNDGDYEPSNCYWATKAEQSRNTRGNHFVEFHGARMILKDACKVAGIPHAAVHERLRRGWTIEKALSTPCKRSSLTEKQEAILKEIEDKAFKELRDG